MSQEGLQSIYDFATSLNSKKRVCFGEEVRVNQIARLQYFKVENVCNSKWI